jgi:hypothetical protein
MAYVGGPGFEFYVPGAMTRHVYLALMNAGADLGLRDAGYYALDALRIEAGCRAWGAELGPDETPFEAGLEFAVRLDKPGFIGREALLAARGQPLRKKLMAFVVDDPAHYRWGGESIMLDDQSIGEVSSAGWSLKAGRCMALGYVRGEAVAAVQDGTAVHIDLWGQPVAATARRVQRRWGCSGCASARCCDGAHRHRLDQRGDDRIRAVNRHALQAMPPRMAQQAVHQGRGGVRWQQHGFADGRVDEGRHRFGHGQLAQRRDVIGGQKGGWQGGGASVGFAVW